MLSGTSETSVPTVRRPQGRDAGAGRRTDPERRDRIIDVCLDVIAEAGVAGTSHRRVAAAADVPLGSMTYHFAGMDELLCEAFTRFARTVSDQFERRMAEATSREAAAQAVIAIITNDVFGTRRDLVLTHELYTLAARHPAYRDITNVWMACSRRALEHHFDPVTARLLDALIEGLTIHRALDTEPHDPAVVAVAVKRITTAAR
ncbi:TetR family transcriptional regulator [Micromonospora sp. CPCC 206060]|uniref:TetR/AcrR family transcriptional regulator n=1 Tax=Micromonospora sp. CPCC 206060 TaxID=3122406 RepID=UPI002FF38D42